MLRTDLNIIQDYFRAQEEAKTMARKLRGRITFDSVDVAARYADGMLIGSYLGIPIYRDAALGNGKFVYKDAAGNSLETNV